MYEPSHSTPQSRCTRPSRTITLSAASMLPSMSASDESSMRSSASSVPAIEGGLASASPPRAIAAKAAAGGAEPSDLWIHASLSYLQTTSGLVRFPLNLA